jgi:integrase
MANRKVAVYKQVKVNGVWVKCPPYINPKNNKPENDKVLVKGVMEVHPEGDWGIFYYENGKRKWKAISPKYGPAKDAADTKEYILRGKVKELAGKLKVEEIDQQKTKILPSMNAFLDDLEARKRSPRTIALLRYDLTEFLTWVRKSYVEDHTTADVLKFGDYILTTPEKPRTVKPHLIPKMRSDRTAANKMMEVDQWYRWAIKLDPGKGLITVSDAPYDESDPEAFTQQELEAFFGVCNPYQHLLFTTFLQTGLRKNEMAHLEWPKIDFENGVVRVKNNRRLSHRVKMGKERAVPIPPELLERLAEHKKSAKFELVFPTRTGKVNDKFWDLCKKLAEKAGQDPEKFFIHKFRATFATTCLREGADVKMVQGWLGHSGKDFSSTSRYLAAASGRKIRRRLRVFGRSVPR